MSKTREHKVALNNMNQIKSAFSGSARLQEPQSESDSKSVSTRSLREKPVFLERSFLYEKEHQQITQFIRRVIAKNK